MLAIAILIFVLGGLSGYFLGRKFFLRTLVLLIMALIAIPVYVMTFQPGWLDGLDRNGAFLILFMPPPLSAGLFSGGVCAWLFRKRPHRA